jgi:hypothetical protein
MRSWLAKMTSVLQWLQILCLLSSMRSLTRSPQSSLIFQAMAALRVNNTYKKASVPKA